MLIEMLDARSWQAVETILTVETLWIWKLLDCRKYSLPNVNYKVGAMQSQKIVQCKVV
jgi:hypothetical protein